MCIRDRYGVDVEGAMAICDSIPLSMHCWQGDDVGGFEKKEGGLTGGIQATGDYPGKARTAEELRADMELSLIHISMTRRTFTRKHGSRFCGKLRNTTPLALLKPG